jgi:hypothetical protein
MLTKGKFLFKKQWYSICSRHQHYEWHCELCNIGRWHNIFLSKISHFIFNHFEKLWIFCVNIKPKLGLTKLSQKYRDKYYEKINKKKN